MKNKTLALLVSSLFLLPSYSNAQIDQAAEEAAAQQIEFENFLASLDWQDSGQGELDEWATIDIPAGFRFLNGVDTDTLLQAFGNLPDTYQGMISVPDVDWFVLFQFEDSGYVKDDEKDELDAEKLLAALQSGDEQSNQYRRQQGIEPLYTEGWAIEPRYNDFTNNLEWGVNYKTKLLGRNGIMNVTLVCDPAALDSILPTYQDILAGHNYKPGKSYAEYRDGDKVATYGLTALIAGGALYGAAKLGILGNLVLFLKKGFKFIIIGLVAIGVALKKFFAGLAGRQKIESTPDS